MLKYLGRPRLLLFPFLLVCAGQYLLFPLSTLPLTSSALQMSGNVLGIRTIRRRLYLFHVLYCLCIVSGRSAATPPRGSTENAFDGLGTTTGLALRSPIGGTTALEPRREGPYIKYGSSHAAVLISFIGTTSYGIKVTCTRAAVVRSPRACAATLVTALILDFLAVFLLQERDIHAWSPYSQSSWLDAGHDPR